MEMKRENQVKNVGQKLQEKPVKMAVLFAAYMFFLMVSLVFIQKQSALVMDAQWFQRSYYLDMCSLAAGFVFAGFYKKVIKTYRIRRLLMLFAGMICAVCLVLTAIPVSSTGFLCAAFLFSFGLGLIGGFVYYDMSITLYQTNHMGKTMGIGASAALLLQYLFQKCVENTVLQVVLILCGLSLTVLFLLRGAFAADPKSFTEGGEAVGREAAGQEAAGRGASRLVWRILLIEVLMELFFFYYNQSILAAMASFGVENQGAYDWPRLCGIISYLAIGLIADYKKRKFVPLACLCLIIPGLITPLIALNGPGHMFMMAIFYVAVMARICYFNLMFWDTAPRTKNPELWAGMGRIVTSVVEIFFVLIRLSALSGVQMIAVELLTLALIVVIMTVNGDLNIAELVQIPDAELGKDEQTPEQSVRTIEGYREAYGLTGKEAQVLEKLISTEENLQELADDMGISRRVLQKYITSIYEKTETKTRVGLLQSYLGFLAKGAESVQKTE